MAKLSGSENQELVQIQLDLTPEEIGWIDDKVASGAGRNFVSKSL